MTTGQQYVHKEAFCLMKYQTEDGSETEWIWNSRDGVTPFVVMSRSGRKMRHVEWARDRQIPEYLPLPGMRIFADLTPERARMIAEKTVARDWDRDWDDAEYPMRAQWPTKDAAVADIAADLLRQPGTPDLIEADPEVPVPGDADVAGLREGHERCCGEHEEGLATCKRCGGTWPCLAERVCARLQRAEARAGEYVKALRAVRQPVANAWTHSPLDSRVELDLHEALLRVDAALSSATAG